MDLVSLQTFLHHVRVDTLQLGGTAQCEEGVIISLSHVKKVVSDLPCQRKQFTSIGTFLIIGLFCI